MAQRRILVVDDEADVRDVWVDALRGAGYAAVGLGTGAEALGRLPALKPDLVLLDMMMPEVDGFEVLARVRANPDSTHIPLLIVSVLGDALGLDEPGTLALGPAGILTKPVDVATLIQRVREILDPIAGPRPHQHLVCPRHAGDQAG